jgi:hypothetical protein
MRHAAEVGTDWLVDQLRQAKQEASDWSEWKREAMRFERIGAHGDLESREPEQARQELRAKPNDVIRRR